MSWEGLTPPYATIVVDPPWAYAGEGPRKGHDGYRGKVLPYSSMSVRDVAALPVGDLCADSRVFLWTTNRYLRHAWGILDAWGITPGGRLLVWCKTPRCTANVTTEFVLIGKVGKPTALPWHNTTWFNWPLQSTHSAKPAAFFDLVESWCPGPYVELFARQPRLGWDSWGYGYEASA